MENVVLVIHLLVAIAMILLILIQRTAQDGGGLTSGGTMGGMFTARGSANILSRATAILAAIFIATSLILTILAGQSANLKKDIDFNAFTQKPAATEAPAVPMAPAPTQNEAPANPETPSKPPSVPMAQ